MFWKGSCKNVSFPQISSKWFLHGKICHSWKRYFNEEDESDPRMPHQFTPNQDIPLAKLTSVGVLHWHFNPETELQKVNDLMKERNYANSDQVRGIPYHRLLSARKCFQTMRKS
jgi:hypothetical protein